MISQNSGLRAQAINGTGWQVRQQLVQGDGAIAYQYAGDLPSRSTLIPRWYLYEFMDEQGSRIVQDHLLRNCFGGLTAFFAVAHERSFTKAGARLGLSQTAVSHAVSSLEKTLGVRLLARNARYVIPTEAGEHLLATVAPRMAAIDAGLLEVSDLRDKPAGTIRITAPETALRLLLEPKLKEFYRNNPDIKLELFMANEYVDLAAEQFDAGVRLGESVAQDMIAVRIGPPVQYAVVATRKYFATRVQPQRPADLVAHNCINVRTMTHRNLWAWDFEKAGRQINVHVDGQIIYNSLFDCFSAAVAGLGVAYVPSQLAEPYVRAGHLVSVLQDWCPHWSGYHLYYPSRRQPSGAMAVLIAALREDI